MTIGSSIVLIAVGAILKFAVSAHVSGFNIQTAGVVLLIVGIIGLILALIYTFYWTRQRPVAAETRVVRDVRDPADRY
jgi:Zn-dependent protease with chaperone function